jgi:hypothetical protein
MSDELSPSPTSMFIFAGIVSISIITALCWFLFPNYYLILLVLVLVIVTGVMIARVVGS